MFVFQRYGELVMHFGWGICCKSFHIKPHSCSLPEETLAYIFLLFPITIILNEVSLGGRPKINFALLKWSHRPRMLFWWLYPCLDWLNCVKIPQGHRLVSAEELQGRRKDNYINLSARQAGSLGRKGTTGEKMFSSLFKSTLSLLLVLASQRKKRRRKAIESKQRHTL